MNKLAVLAFALLLFFSTMLWYLANGSLNEYLKSQVVLQSQYYSNQKAQLLTADFSNEKGLAEFTSLSIANLPNFAQPHVLTLGNMTAELALMPTSQLNSPSIQQKNTTVIHIKQLTLNQLTVWSERTQSGNSNIEHLLENIKVHLGTDYPALYPQISAEMYALKYPDRNEALAIENREDNEADVTIETNQAVIASTEAKQQKRLLGKAQTRIIISSVIVNDFTLTSINGQKKSNIQIDTIDLGSLGEAHGLDSNQLGGELLRRLFNKINVIEKSRNVED